MPRCGAENGGFRVFVQVRAADPAPSDVNLHRPTAAGPMDLIEDSAKDAVLSVRRRASRRPSTLSVGRCHKLEAHWLRTAGASWEGENERIYPRRWRWVAAAV